MAGPARGGKSEWTEATPLQRRLLLRIWSLQAARSSWGNLRDGEVALGHLCRSGPSGYGRAGAGEKKKHNNLDRGDMCPLVPGQVALPKPGSCPIDIRSLVPKLRAYLDDPIHTMTLDDGEVDWEKYNSITPYGAPELNNKQVRLDLAVRMWQGGMLEFVEDPTEYIKVFSVVKKTEGEGDQQQVTSRLVWDLRRASLRFRSPPWVSMGSPALIGHLDLAADLLADRKLFTFQGDVPDFFYKLALPSSLWKYFCLEGVTPTDLAKHAAKQGIAITVPTGARAVATKVNYM